MRNLIILALTLFPAMACGQTNPNNMDDKKQIENLYKQMYQAMIAKDIAVLDTILAEGSVLIHMTGTMQPKKQYLHEIENGTLNYYSVEDDKINITVNGETAEMAGRSRVNAAVYGSGRHTWRLQMKSKLVKADGKDSDFTLIIGNFALTFK